MSNTSAAGGSASKERVQEMEAKNKQNIAFISKAITDQ